MEMPINEKILRISGRCNIESQLVIGKEYSLAISDVECRKAEEVPTDDGQIDKIYTLRLSNLSDVSIISENEIIKSKQKVKSQSQTLRWLIEQKWGETGSELEKEDFYIKEMSRIIKEYRGY